MAKASITPVGARAFTPSSIIGPRSARKPASRPKITGTTIRATMALTRPLMISVMNVATMAKARMVSIGAAPQDQSRP